MMRTLLFTLISLACVAAFAGPVYRWVDENGVVHYSDQPHPNAQKLQVKEVQTFPHSAPGSAPAGADTPPAQEKLATYQGCAVVQPADQQDFANTDAITIAVQT